MQIRLREGVKFEDVKVEGMVVQRHRSGTIVVYPKPRYRRPARTSVDGASLIVRVAGLWAEVDPAGAEAWNRHAEAHNRRAGAGRRRLSGYNLFVRAMAAALREDPAAKPCLAPPAFPVREGAVRRENPTPSTCEETPNDLSLHRLALLHSVDPPPQREGESAPTLVEFYGEGI